MAKVNDAEQIAKALDGLSGRLPGPPRVQGMFLELGVDEAGDPAAFVTVLLVDKTPDSDWVSAKLDPIASAVRTAVRASGVDRWPYVRFARWSDAPAVGSFDPNEHAWRRVG